MDILFKLFRDHLLIVVALLLFIPVSAISVIALVWQSEHEVLWHGSWVFRECSLPGGEGASGCVAQYELSFGNTGDHTEQVRLDWPVDLRRWSMDWQVLNINAGRRRSNDPQFTCPGMSGITRCSIEDFAAGTLLIIKLRCLLCDRTEVLAIEQNPPNVTSEARVYASDPRGTLLFRRLGVWLSWL